MHARGARGGGLGWAGARAGPERAGARVGPRGGVSRIRGDPGAFRPPVDMGGADRARGAHGGRMLSGRRHVVRPLVRVGGVGGGYGACGAARPSGQRGARHGRA